MSTSKIRTAGSFSGAVTLVARNGRVAHHEAHGLMDLETKKPLRRVWNAFLGRPQPDGFRDVVSKYSLDVERISPVHGVGLAQRQATLTRAQAEGLLKGGTARAREHCKAELAKGNFHPRPPQIQNRDAMELAARARMGAKGGYSREGHFKSQRGQL